jgi:hypothetical protein
MDSLTEQLETLLEDGGKEMDDWEVEYSVRSILSI